jgi:transcriptional regulator with XRE-family HTH domain
MIPIDTPADLAEALGLLRRLTGRTLAAVGDELGTTGQRISDYEKARLTANAKTVIRHLAALGHRLAIVPLIETTPADGPSASVADQEAEIGSESRVDDSSAAESRSRGAA